jgi:hypothetical protein
MGEVRDMDEDSPNDSLYETLAKHDQSETKCDIFGFLSLDFTGWSFCTWQIWFARVSLGVFLSCPESHARVRKGCLRWHGSVDLEEVDMVVQKLWVSTWSRSEFFQPQPTQRHRRFLWLEQVMAGVFQFTSIGHVHPYDTDSESLFPLP